VIRFYLDTDDDFDVSVTLDITDEIVSWETSRAVDRFSRAESEGRAEFLLRRGRARASWWRVGRLIEGRAGEHVVFRGFIIEARGSAFGRVVVQARTWLQFMAWRGRTPDVVGLGASDGLRRIVSEAAAGLPGARVPSAAVLEAAHDLDPARRLFWISGDRPLEWVSSERPLYWITGPETGVTYAYGRVGDSDTVGDGLLVGPPQPEVVGDAATVIDRLTAVEYAIENYEYGRYLDELSVLASIERGFLYSGGESDIAFQARAESAAPSGAAMEVTGARFGRYEYEWRVGSAAAAQFVGRLPDVQASEGLIYRQEDLIAPPGASSWRVVVRDRGRPAEATGALVVEMAQTAGVSALASSVAGDLLLEVFNSTGAAAQVDWLEVTGNLRVYQGGAYGDRVTGRYGGASVELVGVGGGEAGLNDALEYWSVVGAEGGPEVATVRLDGRRYADVWGGELGGLLRTDALDREGITGGAELYWIVGARGLGDPATVTVEYELMRYVDVR